MSNLVRDWNEYYGKQDKDPERKLIDLPKQSHYSLAIQEVSEYEKGSLVLEAGCGVGQWVFLLQDMGFEVFGVDISAISIGIAMQYRGGSFIIADVRQLPFRASIFDFIVSFGVVEHFSNSTRAIKEFCRALRSGGSCLVTVPNSFSFHRFVKPILNLMRRQDLGYVGYENFYTPAKLANMMVLAGFDPVNYGLIPGTHLFGKFYRYVPFFGKYLLQIFEKLSYWIESRQQIVGSVSYAIGHTSMPPQRSC